MGTARVFLNPPSSKEYFKPKTATSFVSTVIPSNMKDEGKGYPLQYTCLENSMGRAA